MSVLSNSKPRWSTILSPFETPTGAMCLKAGLEDVVRAFDKGDGRVAPRTGFHSATPCCWNGWRGSVLGVPEVNTRQTEMAEEKAHDYLRDGAAGLHLPLGTREETDAFEAEHDVRATPQVFAGRGSDEPARFLASA